MTAHAAMKDPPVSAAVLAADAPEVLARIAEPDVELALWRRRLPAALTDWLNELPAAMLPAVRLDLRAIEAVLALQAACHACGTPAGPLREALVADITGLAIRFSRLIGSDRVRLRLEAVTDNACSRFHRDCVPLRLLTTYRGPGTQWVKPECAEQALARPDDYPGPVKHLATQDVALFKGCGFPGQQHDRGIVHRSPPIRGSGATRLLLCLDVPTNWTQDVPLRRHRR